MLQLGKRNLEYFHLANSKASKDERASIHQLDKELMKILVDKIIDQRSRLDAYEKSHDQLTNIVVKMNKVYYGHTLATYPCCIINLLFFISIIYV